MAYATKQRHVRRQLQENGTLPPGFENYHGDGHETEHRGGNKKHVWESSDDGDGSEHFVAAGSLPPLAGPTTLAAPQAVMARAPMPPAPPQEVRPPAPPQEVNYIVASPPAVAEASSVAKASADMSAAETQDGFAPDGDMSWPKNATCWPHATQGVGGLVHEPGHNCYKFGYCTVTRLPWRALKPKGEKDWGELSMPLGTPLPFDPMNAIFSDGMIQAVPQVCVRDVVGADPSVGSVAADQRVPRGADFAARQAVADDPRAEQEFKGCVGTMLIQSKYRPQKSTPEKPRSHLVIVYTKETQQARAAWQERITIPIEGAIDERTAFDLARGICASIVDGSIDAADKDALKGVRQTLLLAALVRPPQQEDSYAAAYGTREVGAAAAYARSWSAGADHESDVVRQEREATFDHEDELIAARADAAAAEDAAAEAVRMRSAPQTSDVEIPQTRSPRNVVHAGGEESAVAPAIDVVDSQAEGEEECGNVLLEKFFGRQSAGRGGRGGGRR
jgi:hypothetical protein